VAEGIDYEPCKAPDPATLRGSRSTHSALAPAASPAQLPSSGAMSMFSEGSAISCGRSGQPPTGFWAVIRWDASVFSVTGTLVAAAFGGALAPASWPKLGWKTGGHLDPLCPSGFPPVAAGLLKCPHAG